MKEMKVDRQVTRMKYQYMRNTKLYDDEQKKTRHLEGLGADGKPISKQELNRFWGC
jgi:hypothetical protein